VEAGILESKTRNVRSGTQSMYQTASTPDRERGVSEPRYEER
jgi:hypothetical protein